MASRVQVLVASMHTDAEDLVRRMGIGSDALIGNQCDENGVSSFEYNGHTVAVYSFAERGVGLNRNNTLMRATAEFCLIADDDMRYFPDYAETVEKAFDSHPEADVIVFNVEESRRKKPIVIQKPYRVGWRNFMRFATFRFAFRTESIRRRGIAFNLSFGGGAAYAHGEDSLFLADCLAKGLTVLALPITVAELTYERESTWFHGFDDKYFSDQGALYAAISRKHYRFLCLQDAVRHRRKYAKHGGIVGNYREMIGGAKKFLNK